MKARVLVVVSGLPASGKTTVGRLLSERLSMPLIDKDAILEAMFDSLGCQDRDERSRLSRASDEVLYTVAEASHAAILVNWWNHDSSPTRLRDITSSLVEVFCDCPVEVAAARFEARRRHPGHHDANRSPEEIEEGVRRMRDSFRGPLGVGDLVRIDTNAPLDADSVTRRVRAALEGRVSVGARPDEGAGALVVTKPDVTVAGSSRVYVDMVGDLFHAGHVSLLREARRHGDWLVVGVLSDDTAAAYKRRPIMTLAERVAVIESCRYVDEVIEDAPFRVTEDFLDELAINTVVHGDDLSPEGAESIYGPAVAAGSFVYVQRTGGISTTQLIQRVLDTDASRRD